MRLQFAFAYLLIGFAALLATKAGKGQTVPPLVYLPAIEHYETPTLTPTPTITPTLTLTPTPTETPLPSPTPTPGSANCVPGQLMVPETFWFARDGFIGEVCNSTNGRQKDVIVAIKAFNEAGEFVYDAYHNFDYILYPQQRYCFLELLYPPPSAVRYELTIYNSASAGGFPSELGISRLRRSQRGSETLIEGRVTNLGPITLSRLYVNVRTYNEDSRLTDCIETGLFDYIEPGDFFEFLVPTTEEVDSYDVAASGKQIVR